MERYDSTENLVPMSTGNVRNLAKLFESSPQQVKRTNLIRLKSKSSSSIVTKSSLELYQTKDIYDDTASPTDKNLTFRDIHSKFETGRMINRSTSIHKSANSLECLKLQEIKEIAEKTDEIVLKIKKSVKLTSGHYITYLNEIVELLLKIGQVETYRNVAIQTEKLSTLQVLQTCYSQLREKLEVFLVEDNDELEEHKVSIRASIEKWETMMDSKGDSKNFKTPVFQNYAYVPNGVPKIFVEKTNAPRVEVVRSTDVADDEKILESIKVQNLKNLWERRASSEEILSKEFANNQLGSPPSVAEDTTSDAEEHTEVFNELSTNVLQETHATAEATVAPAKDEVTENGEIEEQYGMVATPPIAIVCQKSSGELECFIQEEKKSSSDNLEGPPVKEANEIQVEFLPETTETRQVELTSEQTEEEKDVTQFNKEEQHTVEESKPFQQITNNSDEFSVEEIDVRYRPSIDVTPSLTAEENLPQTEEIIEQVPDNEFLVTIDKPDENGNQILNDTDLILVVDDSSTKISTDGTVLSKEKQDIADTEDFLNEERKSSQQTPNENNEFLVGEIDTMFGPPTGIIPSLNPGETTLQNETAGEVEEEILDNTFLVIVDKPDENGVPNDTSLTLVGEDSVQTEIQDYTKTATMVNGDKDIRTK